MSQKSCHLTEVWLLKVSMMNMHYTHLFTHEQDPKNLYLFLNFVASPLKMSLLPNFIAKKSEMFVHPYQ